MIPYTITIKHFRQNAKISQYTMAKELNIEQPQYWRYEAGKTELPIRYLLKICEILKVTPNDLLWQREYPHERDPKSEY